MLIKQCSRHIEQVNYTFKIEKSSELKYSTRKIQKLTSEKKKLEQKCILRSVTEKSTWNSLHILNSEDFTTAKWKNQLPFSKFKIF